MKEKYMGYFEDFKWYMYGHKTFLSRIVLKDNSITFKTIEP